MEPKVGVLIPFYKNKAEYTKDILESISSQTYSNITLYVLDDSNDDGSTWEGIKHIEKSIRLPVNVGTFRAYNILGYLAYADECDYVIPVGQDDILESTCIEAMVEKALEGDYDWVNVPGKIIEGDSGIHSPQSNATYESAWRQNPLTSFALLKMSVWKEYNGYDTSITPDELKVGIEDCELWLRLLRDKKKYAVISSPLYLYRSHKDQAHRIAASYGIDKLYQIIRKKHNYYQ
jgi:glycosyltransferase involved in cell wall biosynthesis